MQRHMLETFAAEIKSGTDPKKLRCIIDQDSTYKLVYMPFEHVNGHAKIAIVGITPGPNQMASAYAKTRQLLQAGQPRDVILQEAIKTGAFDGGMRTRLISVLHHFQVAKRLGVPSEADLWGKSADLLHSTSVIPHAVFKGGKGFAGTFAQIQKSAILRSCFEVCFVPTLTELAEDCYFLALGPTPLDALQWCAKQGVIDPKRILGACPHPSPAGGSRIDVFLGKVSGDDLDPSNPVRSSVATYHAWRKHLHASIEAWRPLAA